MFSRGISYRWFVDIVNALIAVFHLLSLITLITGIFAVVLRYRDGSLSGQRTLFAVIYNPEPSPVLILEFSRRVCQMAG